MASSVAQPLKSSGAVTSLQSEGLKPVRFSQGAVSIPGALINTASVSACKELNTDLRNDNSPQPGRHTMRITPDAGKPPDNAESK